LPAGAIKGDQESAETPVTQCPVRPGEGADEPQQAQQPGRPQTSDRAEGEERDEVDPVTTEVGTAVTTASSLATSCRSDVRRGDYAPTL